MQMNATVQNHGHANSAHAGTVNAASRVNVTHTAISMMYAHELYMDAEAFGVAVTRRPGAASQQLTPYERSRLLDVLCHAQIYQAQCEGEDKVFQVWLVPSDAQDAKPRLMWFIIRKDADAYLISLSDL